MDGSIWVSPNAANSISARSSMQERDKAACRKGKTYLFQNCSHKRSVLSLQNFFKFQIFSNESLVFAVSGVNVRLWSFSRLPSHLSLLFAGEDIVLSQIFGLKVGFRLLAVAPMDASR
jgi:hypothetical protein